MAMRLFKHKEKNTEKVVKWGDITLNQFETIQAILTDKDVAKHERIQSLLYDGEKGDISFLSEEPQKVQWQKTYWVKGRKLRLQADMSHFTLSQQIDLQTAKTLKERMAVLLIPYSAKTYNDGYDLNEIREIIGEIRLVDALAISVFLKRQCVVLQILMKDFLQKKMKKVMENSALTATQKQTIHSSLTEFSNLCSLFAKSSI